MAGLLKRKAARTNETIPVPAPTYTHKEVADSLQSEAVTRYLPLPEGPKAKAAVQYLIR